MNHGFVGLQRRQEIRSPTPTHNVAPPKWTLSAGCLHSLVLRVGPLNEATAVQYALQIVHGLQYVHSSNVCVANVAAVHSSNIGHDGQMRIADFGLSYAHPAPEGIIVGTRGTPFNCARELWAEEPIVSDKMVDVWALGIVIYEMLTLSGFWENGCRNDGADPLGSMSLA
ncbi:hypothetical protein SPRG_09102 [Saprolegnia parasitica CBS 223.65]|uniref:Protein kinase domain-containing protein n=1 Tax=Saprolegnia parasitica (strain CBS 223.65) TaxID=695850 RepID=A0A067C446_SAPPC|nr:hypothetical protein SPRG_09102 [Saprolegnia parasitica CBS 223.65]KDO25273.1 hypothetical protein SPRG_09102 [Saprolegnia parasitica CBS 223.65]|eukprot:XP_012203933.1 hypothetical protein SPRG_09102 [Saprolegnia parasitica CBS 223.65]